MTLTDPKTKYAPCPWCGQPGRLMSRTHDGDIFVVQAGCVNDDCPVQPRTKRIFIKPTDDENCRKALIEHSIVRWERRNEQKNDD
jgi:hypothetical protein